MGYRAATGHWPNHWNLAAWLGLVAVMTVGLGRSVAQTGVFVRLFSEIFSSLVTLGFFLSLAFLSSRAIGCVTSSLEGVPFGSSIRQGCGS